MNRATLMLAVLALPSCGVGELEAAVIVLSNPSAFSGSETLLTFEGAGTNYGDPVSSIGGVDFSLSNGNPAQFAANSIGVRQYGPPETSSIQNYTNHPGPPYPDLTLTFSEQINRLAFEMRTQSTDDIQVSLFSGDNFVDSVTFAPSGPIVYYFYGLESSTPFDRAVIDIEAESTGGFELDNLRFEPTASVATAPIATATITPEPSSLALFGMATASFAGYFGWRRRKQAATG